MRTHEQKGGASMFVLAISPPRGVSRTDRPRPTAEGVRAGSRRANTRWANDQPAVGRRDRMATASTPTKVVATCTDCGAIIGAELREDESIVPLGSEEACTCGETAFRRLR